MLSSRIDTSFGTGSQAIFLLLLLASLTLSGCGGGGGGASPPVQVEPPPVQVEPPPPQVEPPPPQVEPPPPQVEPPPPQVEPPPPQVEPPPPQVEPPPPQGTCISTSEGCLTTTQYGERVQELKTMLKNDDGFSNQWGLSKTNADAAWAKLQLKYGTNTAPGTGITLGAIDSGIDQNHPIFSGKTITEIFLLGATDEDGTRSSHGTTVASVMMANPGRRFIEQTLGARGVAWGADITMFAIPVGSGGGGFVPVSLSSLRYSDQPTRFPAVLNEAAGWSSNGRSLGSLSRDNLYK